MSSSPSRHLNGKYKDFFEASAHPTVEHWYKTQATPDLRNKMKTVVNKILDFDFASARAKLRTTYEPAIVKANAIFDKNNGRSIISSRAINGATASEGNDSGPYSSTNAKSFAPVTYQEKTVQWLAFASVAEQNMFRETIGLMIPPSRFSSHRHVEEFDPKKKYWKTESQITDHKSLVCGNLLLKPSEIREIECEVIGKHETQTGTQFSWKTATSRSSVEKQLGGEFKTVSQRAHDSTYRGAPWGVYGDANANKSQWMSQTREDFSDTFFLQDKNQRRFQNYNDNYTGLLSKHYTDLKKEEKQKLKATASSSASAAASEAVSNSFTTADKKAHPLGILSANSTLASTNSMGIGNGKRQSPSLPAINKK